MAKGKQVLEKVTESLKKDKRGMTIQELSNQIKVSRITIAVALAKLEGAGKIDVRSVGAAKLHYWR